MLPLVEFIQEKKVALFKFRNYTPTRAISLLKPIIRSMTEAVTKYPEYKAKLSALVNSTTSVKEGLESGDADTGDVIELAKEYRAFKDFVIQWEAAKELKLERQKKQPPGESPSTHDGLVRMTQESEPVIRKYKLFKDDLPKFINKNFVVKRMPIIPLTIKAFNLEKLKAAKLATDHISFYPILLNQLVLGISTAWVREEFKGNNEAAAKYVLEMMELQKGSSHQIIGKPTGFNGIYWFWVPSNVEVRRLTAATYGGALSINKWGFPFQE